MGFWYRVLCKISSPKVNAAAWHSPARCGMKGRRKVKYGKDLPRQMYCFFRGYSEEGAPSFIKFAQSIGATLAEVEGWRVHGEFERAYRECSEIRRDYLIDNALNRRYDPSFTKFLLSAEYKIEDGAPEELTFKLEVVK